MSAPIPSTESSRSWHPVHCLAAVVAALASVVALGNAIYLGEDMGTDGWQPGAVALCLLAAGYLMVSTLDHALRGRWSASPPRAEPWLSILILVLVWFVLARGSSSRLLLVGLGPTIAAMSAAVCVSLLVYLRERVVLARPALATSSRWPLAAWRCALAAGLLLGVVLLESRPLPTIKPWEKSHAGPTKP